MWQAVGCVREIRPVLLTQTQGSVEKSQENVVLEGDANAAQTVSPPLIGFRSLFRICLGATSLGLRRVLTTS